MQRKVGEMRCGDKSRREESVLSRLRFGHTGLNSTLFLIGKHETGRCECGQEETVEHVDCERYEQDRRQIRENVKKEMVHFVLIDILQNNSNKCQILFHFLRVTNLFLKI